MVKYIKRPAFSGFETNYENADYIIFGFPMDDTASYRSGSRRMPTAIREASLNIETNSLFSDRDMSEVKLHDIGDIVVTKGNHQKQIEDGKKTIKRIRKENKIPVMIGGEHSITESAFESYNNSLFIVFDAHADLRTDYLGNPNSHACVFYKLAKNYNPENLLHVGIRGLSLDEINFAKEYNIHQITSLEIMKEDLNVIINKINKYSSNFDSIYLSFDMDVYDPAYAPGLGTPEPLGLSPFQIFTILHGIKGKIDGIDISEMTPDFDQSGITSVLAAKTLQEILLRS